MWGEEWSDDGKWVTVRCVFVVFAEYRAARIAFWRKLDPSFVPEAWPKRHHNGPIPQHGWIQEIVEYKTIEIPEDFDPFVVTTVTSAGA